MRCLKCYGSGAGFTPRAKCIDCSGTGKIEDPVMSTASLIELRTAERDAAIDALDKLEAMVKRIGGHATPEDQATLRGATSVLAEQGRRKVDRRHWTNRQ